MILYARPGPDVSSLSPMQLRAAAHAVCILREWHRRSYGRAWLAYRLGHKARPNPAGWRLSPRAARTIENRVDDLLSCSASSEVA